MKLISVLFLQIGFFAAQAAMARPIPNAPYYYLLDETSTLSQTERTAIETLLVEHDHLTDQQVMIGVFSGDVGQDFRTWSKATFTDWKVGLRGQDNGILLAIQPEHNRYELIVGSGVDPAIQQLKFGESPKHLPEFVAQATLEVLRALDSPLIHSGKAEQVLKTSKVFRFHSDDPHAGRGMFVLLFLITAIVIFMGIYFITAAEAYSTEGGWKRESLKLRGKFPMGRFSKRQRKLTGGISGSW